MLIEHAFVEHGAHQLQGHLWHRHCGVTVKLQQLCVGCAVAQLLCTKHQSSESCTQIACLLTYANPLSLRSLGHEQRMTLLSNTMSIL